MAEKQRRRAYRILFIDSEFQLRYTFFNAISALGGFFILSILGVYFLAESIKSAGIAVPEISTWDLIIETSRANYQVIGMLACALGASFFFFAFILSKNIVGPMSVLVKHIDELKKGNYKHRTRLRPNDELKPIMQGLNDLSEALEKSKSA